MHLRIYGLILKRQNLVIKCFTRFAAFSKFWFGIKNGTCELLGDSWWNTAAQPSFTWSRPMYERTLTSEELAHVAW
jgi:hypothetical protein